MSTSSSEACCTCATLLIDIKVPYDSKTEKPIASDRRLDCCGRVICGRCIAENPRFATYCPFCQISSDLSPILPQGLRDPPSYSPPHTPPPTSSLAPTTPSTAPSSPPPYSTVGEPTCSSTAGPHEDVLHYLRPPYETLPSLFLLYGVPTQVLRSHNLLYTDTLLPARRYVSIPRSHYTGPSLSPEPVPGSQESEEEEKKMKVRRWMVRTKCVDYDIAGVYLANEGWDLEAAVQRWKGDERWEIEHPMEGNGKGKEKRKGPGWRRVGISGGLSGQLG